MADAEKDGVARLINRVQLSQYLLRGWSSNLPETPVANTTA